MKPGRELNIRIAVCVMEHRVVVDEVFGDMEIYIDDNGDNVYGPLQPYSEDILAAQTVVERMLRLGHGDAMFWKDDPRPDVICRAALLAALQKKGETDNKERRSKLKIVK